MCSSDLGRLAGPLEGAMDEALHPLQPGDAFCRCRPAAGKDNWETGAIPDGCDFGYLSNFGQVAARITRSRQRFRHTVVDAGKLLPACLAQSKELGAGRRGLAIQGMHAVELLLKDGNAQAEASAIAQ